MTTPTTPESDSPMIEYHLKANGPRAGIPYDMTLETRNLHTMGEAEAKAAIDLEWKLALYAFDKKAELDARYEQKEG